MSEYYRYLKYLKYINGVPQDEYKQGDLIGVVEADSQSDCEQGVEYRWVEVPNEYYCDGYVKYAKERKQAYRNGVWENTSEYRKGLVLDLWSTDCGVEWQYRWKNIGQSYCDGVNLVSELVYLISKDMGNSWQDVEPRQTRIAPIELFSDECWLQTEPFTFTFDAGEEGALLDIYLQFGDLYGLLAIQYSDLHNNFHGRVTVYNKCIIDWGDGEIQTKDYNHSYLLNSADTKEEIIEEYNSSEIRGYASIHINNDHVYRTGGIKTIKIWGNISSIHKSSDSWLAVTVKDIISWGTSMEAINIPNSSEETIPKLVKGLTFNSIRMSFLGTSFGKMNSDTFKYLLLLDISGSNGITKFDNTSKFNLGNLEEFYAENCINLITGPDLSFQGRNDNSSKLILFSFSGCTNLVTGPIAEMRCEFTLMLISSTDTRIIWDLRLGTGINIIDAFSECPNLEELPFTYNIAMRDCRATYYNKVNFPKLKKITGNLIGSRMCEFSFKDHTLLEDISNLSLFGSYFKECFRNCTKITTPCKIIVRNCSSRMDPTNYYHDNILNYMFSNTGIQELNLDLKIDLSWSTYYYTISCNYMFSDCKLLTTVNTIISEPYFPSMNYMFVNCDIRTISNNAFNWLYEGSKANIPSYMFMNNKNLTNYPILNGFPMWKFPAFFFGEITKSYTFLNCPLIASEVPPEWGGRESLTPTIIKVETTIENEIVRFLEDITSSSDFKFNGVVEPVEGYYDTNFRCSFKSPGIHTINVYPFDGIVSIPTQTIEIVDWGDAIDITSKNSDKLSIKSSKITKIPYGEKLFSLLTSITDNNFTNVDRITDVDDNIFLHCGNVTSIKASFGWLLSTEKYTKIFAPLINLTNLDYYGKRGGLFSDNVLITNTCGIFKNKPYLTNILHTFINNRNLTSIESDAFNGSSNISRFFEAFADCTNLKGSTPVDENGYKLWERAGKPGYPATIDGDNCFYGCTQLEDYDLIPSDWK